MNSFVQIPLLEPIGEPSGITQAAPAFTRSLAALFSNKIGEASCPPTVLLPYEITLFSNTLPQSSLIKMVLLPYEITLFSNSS